MGNDKVTCNIEKAIGILSEDAKGWTKEINLVSWNGGRAKYDIRSWDPDHFKMGKGVTFNEDEIVKLRDVLNSLDLEG